MLISCLLRMTNVTTTLQHHGIYNTRTRRTRPRRALLPGNDSMLRLSLCCNVIGVLAILYLSLALSNCRQNGTISSYGSMIGPIVGYDQTWHGGHPGEDRRGSCWCGSADQYCMCTPNLAIDLVITSSMGVGTVHGGRETSAAAAAVVADYIWLVRRKDTDQLATMGGFVEVDETVEQAVLRELKEEMGVQLTVSPKLIGVYSDHRRDIRRRTASAVFAVHLPDDFHPQPGDDAKDVVKIPIDDIEQHTYFADHRTILLDYRSRLRGEIPNESTEGDFANDIVRSTCTVT